MPLVTPVGYPEGAPPRVDELPSGATTWIWAIEHIGYPATISLAIAFVMYLLVGKVSDQLQYIEKTELQIQTTLNDRERLFIDIENSLSQVRALVDEHGNSSVTRDQVVSVGLQNILSNQQAILRRLDDIYNTDPKAADPPSKKSMSHAR